MVFAGSKVPAFFWAICLVPPYALAGLLLQRDLIGQIEANQKERPLIKWFMYLVLVGAMEFMNHGIWSGFLTHPAFTGSKGFATLLVFVYFAMYAYAPLLFIWGATGIKTISHHNHTPRHHWHRPPPAPPPPPTPTPTPTAANTATNTNNTAITATTPIKFPTTVGPLMHPTIYPTLAFVSMKHNSKGSAKPSRVALLYGRCSTQDRVLQLSCIYTFNFTFIQN